MTKLAYTFDVFNPTSVLTPLSILQKMQHFYYKMLHYSEKHGQSYSLVHGGRKCSKLSLKEGQYVNIGDDIRIVFGGGTGKHCRLLIDAPKELNIARSNNEPDPAKRKDTYYPDPEISNEGTKRNTAHHLEGKSASEKTQSN